jgi:hypothetical protein
VLEPGHLKSGPFVPHNSVACTRTARRTLIVDQLTHKERCFMVFYSLSLSLSLKVYKKIFFIILTC